MKRALRGVVASLVLAAIPASATTLHAQPSTNGRALAEGLFQEGRRLLKEGNVSDACPKFAESQRLAPKLGTLLNLATCHEELGKTASAWSEFTDAAAQADKAGETERADYARKHAAALSGRLSRLVLDVDGRAGAVSVSLDGNQLGSAVWGTPLPVDPGEHVIEAAAPGRPAWRGTATAPPGPATLHVRVPSPAEDAAQASPAVTANEQPMAPMATPAPTASSPPQDRAAGRAPTAQRVAGATLIGLGAVGFVVGTVYGLQTFSKKDESFDHCVDTACDPEGATLRDDAHTTATVSTIAFAVGVAAVVGGVLLVLTARSPTKGGGGRAQGFPRPIRVDW